MAPIFTTFKNAGRVAVIALALGAGSLSAMPAQAQEPATTFQLDLGAGGGNGSNEMGAQARRGGGDRHHNDNRWCLTDRQIVRGLSRYGYDRVDVRRDIGRNRVEVRANYSRWTYSMRVDRCTGRVDHVQRLRPAFPGGGGFGMQFNFNR